MINTTDFSKRLKKVIEYYGLSASAFADKLAVQRSSISHILSGRNKPSLEFIMKILGNFPEVELYWLMNGKGSFPKITSAENVSTPTSTSRPKIEQQSIQQSFPLGEKVASTIPENGKIIDKIVIFYTDGTFEAYQK
ncbi:helix-turn-helix transcriptional regulator [Kordia sp. YSTF-M3]|uniref:Helix-turn-helix transcriptional regulator n=1 Tax=Kordia aestuariivivens TaxID=2759037 RepID=A0ABR7Q8M4_9FLAO|nr:helix-turn-helix transcriptional regulator [Kordia aestuariivivens]MBC8754914.1 helix-turn-helix transcriptional regulator [Kordia aestuariivivens]